MTLRHLKIFITVCESMNMTEAAASLFMSQSAVSQAVSELEKHYGVKLFDRLSRRLYLTQAGDKLRNYALHMIRMNADIEKDMKALSMNSSLRLGASVTVAAAVLPTLVGMFQKSHPKTDIEVLEDNTAQTEKALLCDKIDIGLVEGEITSPYIYSQSFIDDELVLICGAQHHFAARSVIQPRELEHENFIIREYGSGTRNMFENRMELHGINWKAGWICNNADSIKAAVAAGIGVSVISKMAVAKEVKAGELYMKKIEGMQFDRKFKIVHHTNKYLTNTMRDFIEYCLVASADLLGAAPVDLIPISTKKL